MRRLGLTLLLLLLLLLSPGCQQELGRPPVPRFTVQPAWIAAGDDHETEVVLDATRSADELDDPSVALDVTWSFDDTDVRFVEGGAHDAVVVLTASGERPVTISLTVTDPEGLSSSLSQRLGVVVPEP